LLTASSPLGFSTRSFRSPPASAATVAPLWLPRGPRVRSQILAAPPQLLRTVPPPSGTVQPAMQSAAPSLSTPRAPFARFSIPPHIVHFGNPPYPASTAPPSQPPHPVAAISPEERSPHHISPGPSEPCLGPQTLARDLDRFARPFPTFVALSPIL